MPTEMENDIRTRTDNGIFSESLCGRKNRGRGGGGVWPDWFYLLRSLLPVCLTPLGKCQAER